MPAYDYKCEGCGKIYGVVQSIHDEKFETLKEVKALSCHDICECLDTCSVKRLIGSVAKMNFKGVGFHCNDYHKKYSVRKGKDGKGQGK